MAQLPGIGASLLDGASTLSQHAASLRELPWPAAALLVAVGAGALTIGARQRRAVAALGGAVCGFAAAHFFARFVVPLDLAPEVAGYGGALALLVACACFPPVFLVLAGALPGALAGEHFPIAGHAWWGMAAGAVAGAVAAFLAPRLVAALTAAAVGAALACTGLVALGGLAAPLELLGRRPFLAAGLWGALTVAGVAFQLHAAWGGEGGAPGGGRRAGKPARRGGKGRAPRARAAEGAG